MSEQLKGNPFAEPLEQFVGQHLELDSTLALTYEQRTANLIAVYNSPNLLQYLNDTERVELEKTILERTGLRDA